MSSNDITTASGRRRELEKIGRDATIETIDGILEKFPDIVDRIDIENGFRTNEHDFWLYIQRQTKRSSDAVRAIREKEDRRLFWILGLTSPLWLAAAAYGVYLFVEAIKNYPLQVCAVCGILIAFKVLAGKKA